MTITEQEEIITKLCDMTIPILIEKITDETEKKEIIFFLENTIRCEYMRKLKKLNDDDNIEQKMKEFKLEILKDFNFIRMVSETKEEDENYSKLIKYSGKAYDLAMERCRKGKVCTDKEMYDEYLNIMQECSKKVLDKNKERAKIELSDGLLDLDYAYGYIEFKSMRLAAYT